MDEIISELHIDLIDEEDHVSDPQERLTGFGSKRTCTLCNAVLVDDYPDCDLCIHRITRLIKGEYYCTTHLTYKAIEGANEPKALKQAYHARADYLEGLINKYEENGKLHKKRNMKSQVMTQKFTSHTINLKH